MNKNLLMRRVPRRAAAFTLVELLVVISIIGVLMALLLPAIGAARGTARNAECQNNLKQQGTGVINYETSKKRFPGYVQPLKRSDGVSYLVVETVNGLARSQFNNGTRGESFVSWAGVIAPYTDKQPVYDAMQNHTVVRLSSGADATNQALVTRQPDLICPDDSELSAAPNDAGMTYSANAGAWDYEGVSGPSAPPNYLLPAAGIPGDVAANGIFHNLTRGSVTQRMDTVRDGLATTILLSENIHKEREESTGTFYCWAGVGFQSGDGELPVAEQQFGIVWTPNQQPNLANDARLFQQLISTEGDTAPPYPSNVPAYARPASAHATGAFNVCFADGHLESLASDIDYTVYQRLMTPNGSKCEDPAGTETTAIAFFRALAPLAENDF